MADLSSDDFERATRHGAVAAATTPRAQAARYDMTTDRIIVDLANGATFSFPPRLAQGLKSATPAELAEVAVAGAGFGLYWATLDADLSVAGLLAGRFGTARYMAEHFGAGWDADAAE